MKKLVTTIVVVAVFFALMFTCPDKQAHQTKLKERVNGLINDKLTEEDSSGLGEGLAWFGSMLLSPIMDKALETKLTVDNYVIFSVGKMEFDGKTRTVSFGILNQVFTPSKSQLETSAKKLFEGKEHK